jgi:hypothetical protein
MTLRIIASSIAGMLLLLAGCGGAPPAQAGRVGRAGRAATRSQGA